MKVFYSLVTATLFCLSETGCISEHKGDQLRKHNDLFVNFNFYDCVHVYVYVNFFFNLERKHYISLG